MMAGVRRGGRSPTRDPRVNMPPPRLSPHWTAANANARTPNSAPKATKAPDVSSAHLALRDPVIIS